MATSSGKTRIAGYTSGFSRIWRRWRPSYPGEPAPSMPILKATGGKAHGDLRTTILFIPKKKLQSTEAASQSIFRDLV
jgi:hypothetical protein